MKRQDRVLIGLLQDKISNLEMALRVMEKYKTIEAIKKERENTSNEIMETYRKNGIEID